MRLVIQRVSEASVRVKGEIVGRIDKGLLVLCGIHSADTKEQLDWGADKLPHLRIFEDQQGKMNLSVIDVAGGILLVPNFTLAGDASQGRRPAFDRAMRPEQAEPAFHAFVARLRTSGVHVETGVFRADMKVSLVNDGPVTIVLEK